MKSGQKWILNSNKGHAVICKIITVINNALRPAGIDIDLCKNTAPPPPPPPPKREGISDAGRSAVHSCRGAGASEPPGRLTRRSFSDSFYSLTARTAGWLRRAAVVSLLGLPLLTVFATGAQAQGAAVECSDDGPYEVPHDWALKPSGVDRGDSFRLLFVTSTGRVATATDIATYNTFVQTRAKAGHTDITDSCGDEFKVVGSTSTVDARDNTSTTGTSRPIYWLNGAKVADSYSDFYDGNWDSYAGKTEAGSDYGGNRFVWTGSKSNGTRNASGHLGATNVVLGQLQSGQDPMSGFASNPGTARSFYALSPVFTVEPPPTVSISAPTDANEGNAGTTDKFFTITLSEAITQNLNLRVCYSGTATRGASADYLPLVSSTTFNLNCLNPAPTILTGDTTSTAVGIRIRGDTDIEPDETVIATLSFNGTPPAGVVLGTSMATYTILNDDVPQITIAADTASVAEGTTASFTITTNAPPADDLTINLTVSENEIDGQNFVAVGDEGSKTVTIQAGQRSATYTVATDDDSTPELSGAVTVTLNDGTGYTVGSINHTAVVTILNDDPYVVSVSIEPEEAEGDEGNSGGLTDAAILTFTVNPPRPEGFRFGICLDGGTAERGSSADYQFTNLNNTVPAIAPVAGSCDSTVGAAFSNNEASFSQKIRVNGDSLFEEDETVTVSLQRVSGLGGNLDTPDDVIISPTAGSITYTIQNDDTVPELTITAADMVTEGSPASFTIAANPASGLPTTVNLMVSEADGDGNFVASGDKGPKSFLLPAGVGSARYEIDTVYDNTDVENGTLTVALATGDGYTIGSTNTAVVAIINEEPHVVSISIEPAEGDEGNSGGLTDAATLTFTVNPPRPGGFRFSICLDGGTAEPGSSADYQFTSLNDTVLPIFGFGVCDSTLDTNFSSNQASFVQKIRVNGDSLFEADETVTVSLQRVNDTPDDVITSPTAGSVTYTIRNDDDPPMISIAGGSPATEGAGTLTYTLTADKPPVTDLTIDLTVMDAPGSDFIAAEGDQTVTFPAGTTALNYAIPITDDEVDEASGEVTVTINDGTGYTAGTDTATIRVRDDDATTVTLAENPAGDLDEGARKQITLTVNRPLGGRGFIESLFVRLMFGGTATLGTDYTLTGISTANVAYGRLDLPGISIQFSGPSSEFAATTATLILTTTADGVSDSGEDITIAVSSVSNAAGLEGGVGVIGTSTIAFDIIEQPALVLNPSTLTIDEGDTATYTVSLATQPNAPVAMTVSGQADTDLTLSDDTLNFTTQNWNQPQTITVTAGSDDDAQSDAPIALLHTATGGDYAGVTGEVTVTITEDDTAGITVQPTTLAVDEGGTNNYTVVLTSAPAGEVIITVDSGTVATVNNDMLTFTQSNWNQAQTVTVTGMDDAVHNAGDARPGTITHAISQGDSGDYPADRELDLVQLTVADNDDPTLSVQVVGDHTSIEEGGARMIQITVSPDTGETFTLVDVRLLLDISDGYELTLDQTDTSLDPTLQFEVSVTDNDQDGADGMLTIDVSSVSGYAAGSPATLQLTVNDNDQADIRIAETGSVTRVAENGGTDSYTVALTSQPTASVTVTAAPGTGITMTDTTLTFTSTDWNQSQTLIVTGQDNNDDDASDRRVAIRHTLSGDSQYSGLSIDDLMVMVDDDDPTEVSLTRTGSTGAIDEGQAVTFTVELGRALIAGEIIEVPLSIAGTDVEPADWSLALQSVTGVVLSNESTMTPLLRFENAGAQTAELTLTAIGDNTMEGSGSETFIIALGPDGTVTNGFDHSSLNTNVGGGADPDSPDHFSVQVNDVIVMPMITITGGATVTEGMGSASFTLTATPAPMDALTLMLNVTGGSGFIATSGAQSVTLNSGSSTVTYLIATQGDAVDEANGTVTVTVGDGTGYEVGDPSEVSASVAIHDDDATPVTLAGDPGNVAEGDSKPLTVTLGRALEAGEQLTVRLTFGGTALFGTDYTLTGTAANGVDYSDLSGGSVTFSAGGQIATLTLMAQTDAVAETGGETVRIALGTLDSSSGINLGGGASGMGNVDFTIQEQPALVLSTTRLTLIEGDSASYRVSLAVAPSADVMVTLTGTNAELQADGTTLTFTSQNWGNPQTVTLMAVTDSNTVMDQVTLTHSADAGYDSVTADLEVIITDSSPQLQFSSTEIELDEGGSTTYTLQLSAEPAGTVTVALSGYDGTALAPQPLELTFTQDNWNQAQTITLSAGTDSNSVNEAAVTLVHTADAGYGEEVTEDVTVTMTDTDAPRLIVGVNTLSVTEQGSATYTVTLATEPSADVTVTITGQSGDLRVDSGTELTFTQSNWNEGQVVTLSAIADDDSEDEALITLTHTASGGGYGTASAERLSVRILDSTRGLVLSESSLDMEENDTASYTVRLALRPMADVTVRVSSGDATRLRVTGGDRLTFTPTNWNQAQTVTVTAADDIDSDANQVILTHTADAGYDPAALPVEIADDDESADMTAMQAAQQMWLPRFGLTAVEHMLGGLDYRFTASSQPGLSGNLNGLPRGQSFNAARLLSSRGSPDASAMGIEQLGAGSSDRPRKLSRTLSLPKLLPSLLRGSHFTFTDQDGTSIWGQAAYTKYKDGEEAGTSIDGEVTTAMLGIDRDNGQTLVGLALAYSDSDGEWQGASDEGELSGMLVSMLPYLRYDLSERLQLWGAASYGRGDLKQTQTSQTGMESKHNLVQLSATAGLRGTLLERPVEQGGLTLELISGLTLARIEADDSRVMAGTEADTQRFRMGLAWSWQLPEEDGVRLTPELELGLRYDGGDTSEGFGLELGGGLSWQTPAKGLTVDVRGRYLLEHEAAEREEWGLSGSLRYEAWPNSAYGPSFSLRHEYGNAPAASGLDRLLSDSLTDALEEEDNRHTAAVSSRWTLKGEWGFALTDDATGIPYASLSASDAKRDLTLGWRLLSNPAGLKSKLDIKAIRREQDDNNPRHSVGAQWKLNW